MVVCTTAFPTPHAHIPRDLRFSILVTGMWLENHIFGPSLLLECRGPRPPRPTSMSPPPRLPLPVSLTRLLPVLLHFWSTTDDAHRRIWRRVLQEAYEHTVRRGVRMVRYPSRRTHHQLWSVCNTVQGTLPCKQGPHPAFLWCFRCQTVLRGVYEWLPEQVRGPSGEIEAH